MITEDLIAYIQAQLRKNISKDIIVSKLVSVGWHIDDINEAFIKLVPPSNLTPQVEKRTINIDKSVYSDISSEKKNDPYHEKVGTGEPDAMSKPVWIPNKYVNSSASSNVGQNLNKNNASQEKITNQNIDKPVFSNSFSEANPKPILSPLQKGSDISKLDTTKSQIEVYNEELIPALKPKINIQAEPSAVFVPKVSTQLQKPQEVKADTTKLSPTIPSTTSSMKITPNAINLDVPENRGIPQGAMLHSYQKALISVSEVSGKQSGDKKHTLTKWLITILVISAIGGSIFAYMGNHLTIPKFNFSFIKKDPKALLIESSIILNELKSYKIETSAKISLPPISDITSGLVSGKAVTTSDTDYVSMTSTGLINHNSMSSPVFAYNANFNSSFFRNSIDTSLKYSDSISLVTTPDFTELLGINAPKPSDVLVSKGQFDVFAELLPNNVKQYIDKIDLDKFFAIGVPSYIDDDTSAIFKDFVNSSNVLEKDPEEIKGTLSYHYSLNADKPSAKKFITAFINLFTTGMSDGDKETLSDRLGAVSFESLDVWIGEKDNKMHQYSFKLSTPLSRLIGFEDKGIAGNIVTLDWKTTYYDFDIHNNISMPSNAKSVTDYSKEINDMKIKEKITSFKPLADIFHNATGNFGKRSNQTGSCTNPNPSSVFSPVGNPKGASSVIGDIAGVMNDLLSTTGGALSCYSTSGSWALSAPLATDPSKSFCIDNTGITKTLNTPLNGPICK